MDNRKIIAVSYIGKPVDYTAMFVTKKAEKLIVNLKDSEGCMVFAETGTNVPFEILNNNNFIFTDNPQREYTKFAQKIADERDKIERKMRYRLTDGLYYIGENVRIGEGTMIEPGALIGHNVVIGKNALIKAGAIIKNAVIGDDFIICENSVIGTNAFTTAIDEEGNNIKIPALGKIVIGNNVEIGSLTNVSRGSAGETVVQNNVKVDSLVHIGHDVYLCDNVEITAGTVVAGFTVVGNGTFVGVNSSIRNRITIGDNSYIGMGSVVNKSIDSNSKVVGNPIHELIK